MDSAVIEAIRAAGLDPSDVASLRLVIERDADGRVRAPVDACEVLGADGRGVPVALRRASELCEGMRPAPDLRGEPPAEYRAVIELIERTVAACVDALGTTVYDEAMERVYAELARRPDGKATGPLSAYARAAARLALAVRATSKSEYEAITRRLAHSARTFRTHATSTNYQDVVLREMILVGDTILG